MYNSRTPVEKRCSSPNVSSTSKPCCARVARLRALQSTTSSTFTTQANSCGSCCTNVLIMLSFFLLSNLPAEVLPHILPINRLLVTRFIRSLFRRIFGRCTHESQNVLPTHRHAEHPVSVPTFILEACKLCGHKLRGRYMHPDAPKEIFSRNASRTGYEKQKLHQAAKQANCTKQKR